jgi:glycosyltransferase involved in cell wall biosynthesis
LTKQLKLVLTGLAYLPEAYAYERYLRARGWSVEFVSRQNDVDARDLAIRFMGFEPWWRGLSGRRVIHEYHSRSTGKLAAIKDQSKTRLNVKPIGRIFLNDYVRQGFPFSDPIPEIYRDMAVDEAFYQVDRNTRKIYDVVYCGSIGYRQGVVDAVQKLDRMGISVLLIGGVNDASAKILERMRHVTVHGRATREQIPPLFAQARFGLNFTPDVRPLNRQTSTKTLEYMAAGLGVISNRYAWSQEFEARTGASFVWFEDLRSRADLDRPISAVDMSAYSWETVLDRVGFENFLLRV